MPRTHGVAALGLAGSLLAGCATSDHLYLVRREVQCTPFGEPIEFLPGPPAEPHVAIARIEASGAIFVPITWEMLRLYLCREALAVEADAVFGLEQEQVDYSIGFTPLSVDWTNKRLTAVAVRFLEPGETPEEVEVPMLDEEGEDRPADGAADEPAAQPGPPP